MRVGVGSMFRDSSSRGYLDRTFDQYERLAKELDARGDEVTFLWVESGSEDDTFERLSASKLPHVAIQMEDGCPFFESVDDRKRWRHLAWLSNGVLDLVTDEDRVLYVESDLRWDPADMLRLLDHLDAVDVVSALNVRASGAYYDLWGSKGMDGRRFGISPPFHPSLVGASGLVEVQSMAGCTAVTGEVARTTRFSPDDCYRGWNRDQRLQGFKVWCDPEVRVIHD